MNHTHHQASKEKAKFISPLRPGLACSLVSSRLLAAGALALTVALPLSFSGMVQAATFTWDGGGGDSNWSTGANWNPDGAPDYNNGAYDTLNFAGSTGLTANNNRGDGDNINSIIFDTSAGAFILTGGSLDMLGRDSAGSAAGTANITNNSANTQTINNDLIHRTDFNTGLVFNNTAGGTIKVGGQILNLAGSTDPVTIQGDGTVILSAANNYTDLTVIDGGTFRLLNDTGSIKYWTGKDVEINNGSRFEVVRSGGGDTRIVLNSNEFTFDNTGGGVMDMTGNIIIQGTTTTIRTTGGAGDVVSGSAFNLQSNPLNFDVADDGTAAVDLTLSAGTYGTNGKIVKSGTGTMTLTGTNTYTGVTDINAGKLQLGDGGTTGSLSTSSAIDIASGATFIVNQSDTVTQGTDFSSAAITGAGTIAHHGTGILILDRANNLTTGGTHIGDLAGLDSATRILEIQNNSSLGTGQITFYKGGTLDLGADALTVNNFIFNGNYSSGTKTIKLDSDGVGHTGTIAGNMIIQNQNAGSFQMDVGAADTLTMSGTIGNYSAGGAGITKIGDGTLILSGTNTYKGNTTLDAGTLQLSGGSAIPDGSGKGDVVVNASGTLDVNGSSETINGLRGSGIVDNTAAGAATLTVGNNNDTETFSGTIQNTGGNLTLNKIGTGTQTLTGVGNAVTELNVARGDLVLSGSSTTTVSGRMRVSWGGGSGSPAGGGVGSLTVQDNAELTVDGAFGVGQNLNTSGSVTQSGGTVNLNGPFTIGVWSNLTGTYTISGGELNATNNNLILGNDGKGYLNVNGGTVNVKGVDLAWKANSGREGHIALDGGTLNIGSGGISRDLNAYSVALNSGTLGALAGWSADADVNMTLGGSVDIDTTGGDIVLNGGLSGGGGFTKEGTGTLTLNGANTFTGNVAVDAGTLKIGNKSALGAINTAVGKVTVASGATVDFNGVIDAEYGYTISGTGVGGNGALVNNGAAITTFYKQASNITLADDASIGGTGDWALLAGGYGATTLDLAGNTLTKSGANTFTLSNATVTAGSIQIDEGTFTQYGGESGGSPISHDLSAVEVSLADATTATLSLQGGGGAGGTLNLSVGSLAGGGSTGGNVDLGAGTLTVGDLNTPSTTYAGVISGTGGLTKVGTGIQTLSGINTYTGTTDVNAGTLLVNGDNSGATGDVTVNSGGTLGGIGNVGGATTLNGGKLSPGDGGIGVLTFQNAIDVSTASPGSLLFDLAGGGSSDRVVAKSTLTIGTGFLNLDDFEFANLGIGTGGTYVLFDASSGGTLSGTIANNAYGELFGLKAVLTQTSNQVLLTVSVPEPSSTALLGLGGVALLLRRRRAWNGE